MSKQQTNTPPPLSNTQKSQWNAFIDFMDKQGYKGNPVLDNRDQNLGQFLFDKFKSATPGIQITYQDVPRVQSELQDYRSHLVNQYKQGKIAATPDIKSEADIMAGLSPVDGWLGSKTSTHKFPVATVNNSDGTQTNYGVNTASYDKARNIQ